MLVLLSSLNPIENVSKLTLFFNERTKLELSMPPDKNAPMGTSEANRELVAFLSLSIIFSLALSYDL